MGMGPEWLATKHRSPAEDAALRAMGKHPSQRRGTSATSQSRARSGRSLHMSSAGRRGARPPTANTVSFQTEQLTAGEAQDALRAFLKHNRWRLHDLFARHKQYEEDYRLPADLVTHWLLVSGGLQPPTTGEERQRGPGPCPCGRCAQCRQGNADLKPLFHRPVLQRSASSCPSFNRPNSRETLPDSTRPRYERGACLVFSSLGGSISLPLPLLLYHVILQGQALRLRRRSRPGGSGRLPRHRGRP